MGLRFLANGALVGDTLLDALQTRDASRLRRYREYLDIYEGKHWLSTSGRRGGRSTLTLNYARAVVDKGVSYLLGRGLNFAVPADASTGSGRAIATDSAERAERCLYDVYQDNNLDAVDMAAALNAGLLGDAVFKVFYDTAERRVRVVNVDPLAFFPRWSGDDLGSLWRVDLAYRLPAHEVQRLYGRRSANGVTPVSGGKGTADEVEVVERWTTDEFTLMVGREEVRAGPNPYGFIPFVHVANLQPPNEYWGVSDLRDVIGLNRALNERMSDQADLIRYHADPPVVFRGVSEHTDLAVGPGTVWDLPMDGDVKLLEWQGAAPDVGDHIDRLLRAMYEISETPRTAFGDSGRLLSGVALETELRPLIQKTLRKRVTWTAALRRRSAMVLQLAERFGVGGARVGEYAPYRTRVIWPPMIPRDDAQEVQNNLALVQAGLRSHRTAMDALGTEDPEKELEQVLEDRTRLDRSSARPSMG
jgi:hypothetical protein